MQFDGPQITRIAPSPTGMFHLGTLRTAYMNYLIARASGGRFILRIDDTDVERNRKEYIDVILDTLHWLDLEYDELYYQSERTHHYTSMANWLLEREKAFTAVNGAVILKGFVKAPNSFKDEISGDIGITETNIEQINNRIVLLRGDNNKTDTIEGGKPRNLGTLGQPTYQFASIVDDWALGVTNIVRGVDHITNTPKQLAIWQNIEFDGLSDPQDTFRTTPKFTHMGLIFKDGKKLSKREGAASVLWYKEQGYKPEAILSWVLRMGWSLKIPRDIPKDESKELQKIANGHIGKDMAIELFPKGSLKNSPCNYDIGKLNAIQKVC